MHDAWKRTLAAVVAGVAFAGSEAEAVADPTTGASGALLAATSSTSTSSKSRKPAKSAKPAKPAKPAAAALAPVAATSQAEVENLKAMVPARIGRWKRVAAPAAAPVSEAPSSPGVQAEFAAGGRHIALEVSKASSAPAAPDDLPRVTRNEAGHELVYREGREIVVERVRHSDGQAQVTLRRDDGLTVVTEGTGIAPERLKAVARAVGRRG